MPDRPSTFFAMSPRKRARPNPSGPATGSTASLPATLKSQPSLPSIGRSLATASGETSAASASSSSSSKDPLPPPPTTTTTTTTTTTKTAQSNAQQPKTPAKQLRKSTSWYGSLGRKSSASTQVARETIMGGSMRAGSTPDFARFESKRNPDPSADSDAQSIRTMPQIPEDDTNSKSSAKPGKEDGVVLAKDTKNGKGLRKASTASSAPVRQEDTPKEPQAQQPTSPGAALRPSTASSWFGGWFGAPSAENTQKPPADQDDPMPDAPKESESEPTESNPKPASEDEPPRPETPKTPRPTSSWLGSWWNTPAPPDSTHKEPPAPSVDEPPSAKESEDVVMEDAAAPPPAMESQPSAGSTWAFWSRDTGSKSGKTKSPPEQGELAVMGEGSEASPRRSIGIDVKDDASAVVKEPPLKKAVKESPTKAASSKNKKRVRPQSLDLDESSRPTTPVNKTAVSKPETPGSVKAAPPNLLLPSFHNTYRMKQNPSIIKQIAQLLLRTQQPPANHVFLVKEPPKIKKAIAIGVHGLFPATYLRPMIGQPTGTSLRFANHCAEAIRRWADSHGCEDCEIEKVALEGEGKIADRVDNLWKLLLNWIEHIRSADLILVACHSQGVPVGLMLVAKLIDLGIITTARIGVCAMAGVSLGPFPDYKSGMGMLMGSAAELWQFADPQSDISQRLEHSIKTVLDHGARVTYIGSIDDQLVPMESAIYSPASHPYIYRAVFVDGRIHAPDFIAHLVGFALKLRNMGISDQGLIRELSVALAGSLYSGEGHSRLYDDDSVYDLAVSHALETTVVNNVPCRIDKHEGLTNPNPYVLPWIMRGLLEEDFVKTELSAETAELLKQFDDWKPVTKALKDIKFRLEAVRSKL
ncbi:uncharacterized protein JN550_006601 [Neoarthrinium moseri]|uniref:uncharacterized protein n=1 Tax=Neoarthrinium moseri TaxID=1658444 RepID=UPI001FDCF558|nr:uncharacterized protein JN550_006601 [Neoarthrinium moseri]KAI1868113.1 hypothetical protein JN550_006601 [Neoarthrinium moseri]